MTFEQLKQRALAEWETQGKTFPLSDLVISDPSLPEEGAGVALRHMGKIDPDNIYAYIACDGYTGLSKALSMTGEDVIGEVAACPSQRSRRRRLPRRRQADMLPERCRKREGSSGERLRRGPSC